MASLGFWALPLSPLLLCSREHWFRSQKGSGSSSKAISRWTDEQNPARYLLWLLLAGVCWQILATSRPGGWKALIS